MLQGDAIREITLEGPGAGGIETASAVVADLVSIVGTTGTGFLQGDPVWRQVERMPPGELSSLWYLRLLVEDRAGVLARLAQELAVEGVSVARLVQQPANGHAVLHVVTHEAPARPGRGRARRDPRASRVARRGERAARRLRARRRGARLGVTIPAAPESSRSAGDDAAPHRAVPRPAAGHGGDAGRLARRGVDAAARRADGSRGRQAFASCGSSGRRRTRRARTRTAG